ncbi:MAG: ribokinase, partial [Cloacibacterium normanense]|nr:ribokinase [Cloacibacterium normanense]
ASTFFIGCVGMDPYGQQILRNLVDENVNVGFVHEDLDHATGTAYVTAAHGKNAIVVVPSANYCLEPKHLENAERFFSTADLVLTQLEIPMNVVEKTYEFAKKYNKKLGIYASPAARISEEILEYASFIVAKSNELSIIFGEESREKILRKYPNKLFVRDDANSTIYHNGSEMKYHRNDPEDMPNKMGMGDAFTSGFSIALCHGNEIDDCVKFGNDVSLKVAQKRGSQTGLPKLKDFGL